MPSRVRWRRSRLPACSGWTPEACSASCATSRRAREMSGDGRRLHASSDLAPEDLAPDDIDGSFVPTARPDVGAVVVHGEIVLGLVDDGSAWLQTAALN